MTTQTTIPEDTARRFDVCIGRLPERHKQALRWFANQAGRITGWPATLVSGEGHEETLLATKAKGIYKPAWSEYALSVRQTLDGPYHDREPVLRPDGTWVYQYFQESGDVEARDDEFTNRGLVACWRDSVPVGVMRQTRKTPRAEYRVEGVALVAGWDGGYFFFEGFSPSSLARRRGAASEVGLLLDRAGATAEEPSASGLDARERVMASIVRRRGQGRFRDEVLRAYGRRCAISGCDAEHVLEAAHISPYRGPDSNDVRNGLLLRSDLHTLFDLGLIAIDIESWTVVAEPSLQGSSYAELHGRQVALPIELSARPSETLLAAHRTWTGL